MSENNPGIFPRLIATFDSPLTPVALSIINAYLNDQQIMTEIYNV